MTVVLVYALSAAGWILLSDEWVRMVFGDPDHIILADMLKDWLFVAVTSSLLYGVLRRGQQLALAQAMEQSQVERLRALDLLAAIADSSDDAIFAKDLEGRFILFNRAAGQFVGKSAEEVLGRDERAIFPAGQAEALMAVNHQVIAENRIHAVEELLSMPEGERIFLSTKGPLRDAEGKVIGIFGISRDITARKQAELALRESEEFKQAILDSIDAHIAVLDRQGVIVAVNRPWQQFAEENGLFPGELLRHAWVGVSYLDVCRQSVGPSSEGAPDAWEGIQAVLHGRLPRFSLEYPCHSPTQQRWFSMTVTPLSGEGRGGVIAHADITRRKLIELALRDSERHFRQLFSLAPLPLAIANQDGVLTAFNDRFVSTFGYTLADVPTLAEWWLRAYPDPDYRCTVMDGWNAAVQRAVEQDIDIPPLEFRVTCKDGGVRTVVISGIIIGTNVLAAFVDITERKSAEEAMRRQAEELVQRNEELERFNRAMVGRELDMIALKQQVNELSRQLGQEPPYPLAFLNGSLARAETDCVLRAGDQ